MRVVNRIRRAPDGKELREVIDDAVETLAAVASRAELRRIRWLRAHPLRGDRTGRWALDPGPEDRLIVRFNRAADGVTLLEVVHGHKY